MSPKKSSTVQSEEVKKDFRPDYYVKLMSGINYTLNLSRGKGREPIRFNNFGDVKRIQYGQLVEMISIDRNERFFQDGFFYILDDDFVEYLGFRDVVEKVLNKERIERIISEETATENAMELYISANIKQKSLICDMLIQGIRDNKAVNMNLVHMIEKESKVKIIEKAEEAKEVMQDNIP